MRITSGTFEKRNLCRDNSLRGQYIEVDFSSIESTLLTPYQQVVVSNPPSAKLPKFHPLKSVG